MSNNFIGEVTKARNAANASYPASTKLKLKQATKNKVWGKERKGISDKKNLELPKVMVITSVAAGDLTERTGCRLAINYDLWESGDDKSIKQT